MYRLTHCIRSLSVAGPQQYVAVANRASRQAFSSTPPTSSSSSSKQPVLGIAREDVTLWERRAPLSPNHVETLIRNGVKVLVQPSSRRAYSMTEYESAGAVLTDDLSEADTIVGVKKVAIEHLIPNKTYLFFSHTIKAQKDNMPLLDAIKEKNICLVDYEKIVDNRGVRQVAFGQYAGIAGMINILNGLGTRLLLLGHHTPFMHVGLAHNYPGSSDAMAAIAALGREIQCGLMPKGLGPMIFTFTGAGNVSQGAQSVFRQLPHEYILPKDVKEVARCGGTRKLYATVVDMADNLVRKDGGVFSEKDYKDHPEQYTSIFAKEIAPYTTCLINGLYWGPESPRIITVKQCKDLMPTQFSVNPSEGVPRLPQRLLAIADISCDMNGSLEFVNDVTSIDSPFVLYNAHTEKMNKSLDGNGILLMAVDNLPAQLPREATDFFGSKLLPFIPDCLKLDRQKPLQSISVSDAVKNAVITHSGSLTEKFKYIDELRKRRMQ